MAQDNPLASAGFSFQSDPLVGIAIRVERFESNERLSEPYLYDVAMTIDSPDVDVRELLGHDCVILLERAPHERRFCGIVRSVWEGERTLTGTRARVHVAPALSLLSLRRNTRMFQEKTVPEILEAVLGETLGPYGRSVELDLTATYPRREYCLQYQETDLAFVMRLMEEEGIAFSFDHAGEVEMLVLRDANASYARVEGATDPIPLVLQNLHARDTEAVHHFERRHTHTTTSVALRDFDWTSASLPVEDEERGEDVRGRDRESYEHGLGRSITLWDYAAAARRYQERDVARQKLVRLEAHRRDAIVGQGIGRVVGFTPGMTFELVGHHTIGLDGEYLITAVQHVTQVVPLEEQGTEVYHNRFECIPLDVPYRPLRRTPKPRIASVQTAIVTGPSGEEIHTDEHGRIKVRFHWDRENPADETSSCWLRCEQAWGGAGWGFWWLPRIGMEVVVHFIDGDPDRPIVTGSVYNGANTPPYPLPDEKTKSTIKSNSSPGGGGFNEFRFEDAAGSEQIYTHAQKDYNEVVLNDHTTTVHHDQTITVDNDQTQNVGNNQVETVHGNQDLSVGANRTVHVDGTFDEQVDGTETRTVTGDVTETFDANETRTIGASVTEDIGGNETRTIGASHTEDIGASHTLTISGSSTRTIIGSLTQTVAGGITTTTPATYNITAVGGLNVTAAGGVTFKAPAGVKIIAPGGVTWIDSNDTWFGSVKDTVASHLAANFTAVKLGIGGVSIGVTGIKFEACAAELKNKGAGKHNLGAMMGAGGAKLVSAGFNKITKGITGRGS